MKFEMQGAGGLFLKVREGAYLRVSDITAITVGTPADDGSLKHTDTVFVHLRSGGGAAFDPCERGHEDAVAMADELVFALEKNVAGL